MRRLVAVDLPGGPAFVDALRRAWDAGDAVLPIDQRFPRAAKAALMAAMGANSVVEETGTSELAEGRPVEDGDALVVATSGSTGTPKGVVLTHEAVAASAEATSARLEVDPERDHWLACLPLAHVGGLSVVTRALHTETPLTVIPGFDVDTVDASDATLVSLVATAMRRIDTGRWRVIVLGGAHAPTDRPANSVTTYGMTETGSGVVYDGVPLDGVEVRIVGDEIQVRAPMLLRCYRDGTDPFVDGGWFPTGDLGEWADDGTLIVHGRRGDLIITGGENVWPDPVERVLARHPAVADVGVAGVPDPEWGQIVTAYVVPTDDTVPTLEALRDAVRAELPAYCAPRNVVIVEQLPRTTLGKLQRTELADVRRLGSP